MTAAVQTSPAERSEPDAIDRAVEGVTRVLRRATPAEAEAFAATVEAESAADGLDPALWGVGPGEPGSMAAGVGNLATQFEARRRVEAATPSPVATWTASPCWRSA